MRHTGPVIPVQVGPILETHEAWRRERGAVPSATILALLDTGASGTLVRTSVLERLGLEAAGPVFLNTPSTTEPEERSEYRIRLVLAKNIVFETDVVEAPLGGQHVQCLIGRDILDVCRFVYDGPRRRFTLTTVPGEE